MGVTPGPLHIKSGLASVSLDKPFDRTVLEKRQS
jgi:hypothetical protein